MTGPSRAVEGLPTIPRRLLLGRALVLRCPVCGRGRLFRRWFTMLDRCPRCGLHFERERGQWTGHLGLNSMVSFGAVLAVLLGFALLTWPELPATAAIATAIAVAIITPLAFYPWSKTLWLALDLAVDPVQADELRPPAS